MTLRDRIRFFGADLSTHLMLDDVNLGVEAQYASAAFALAGYLDGNYDNWNNLVAQYKTSGKYLLSIDVANNSGAGAQCLDIETGDATIADAPAWTKITAAQGALHQDARFYPKLYTSIGNAATLVSTMTANGIPRNSYMLWSAHYTQNAHICGPKTCGYATQADATQWTSSYQGVSLDASLCFGYFFTGPNAPAPAPAKIPEPVLRMGSTGAAVKLLQGLLNTRWFKPSLVTDGIFGSKTQSAVMELERNNKVLVDGVAGPVVWGILGNYS